MKCTKNRHKWIFRLQTSSVQFISARLGNQDEVSVDLVKHRSKHVSLTHTENKCSDVLLCDLFFFQERRLALQKDVDKESQPKPVRIYTHVLQMFAVFRYGIKHSESCYCWELINDGMM